MKLAVLALGIVVGASACNGNTPRTDEHVPAVATTSVSVAVHPTVAWPSASSVDDGALASLASIDDHRALISRSPVPVLAPKELRLASPTLVVEGEYFALTGRVAGATISLQGTRAAHRYEGIEPASGNREVRNGIRGFVTVNENVRTVSWMENGVAYSIDVECSDHRDLRCQTDDFVLSAAAQLAYVGGSGR